MATEAVPNETENHLRTYQIVYQMTSRETVTEQQCKRQSPNGIVMDSLDNYIGKKYFRPGGMAPSEWTRSVRAVRDTPVVDYSAPGVNSTGRVPYRPLIAV